MYFKCLYFYWYYIFTHTHILENRCKRIQKLPNKHVGKWCSWHEQNSIIFGLYVMDCLCAHFYVVRKCTGVCRQTCLSETHVSHSMLRPPTLIVNEWVWWCKSLKHKSMVLMWLYFLNMQFTVWLFCHRIINVKKKQLNVVPLSAKCKIYSRIVRLLSTIVYLYVHLKTVCYYTPVLFSS